MKIQTSITSEREIELKMKFSLENPTIEVNNGETTKLAFLFTPSEEEFGATINFFKNLSLG